MSCLAIAFGMSRVGESLGIKTLVFNEKVMYKDRSNTIVDVATHHVFDFVSMDDLPMVIVQSIDVSDEESGPNSPIPIIP